MSPEQLAQEEKAAQFIAICRKGFDSEIHHRKWMLKHQEEIYALPKPQREAVLLAHEQATSKAHSK